MRRNGKRSRYSDLDDSQKTIKSFLKQNSIDNNTESQNKLRSCSKLQGESASKATFNCVQKKKQTLLVPFDKTDRPNLFKIRKMDGKSGEKSQSSAGSIVNLNTRKNSNNYSNGYSHENEHAFSSEEREFDLELIECCEKVDMTLSEEKLKLSRNNTIALDEGDCRLLETNNGHSNCPSTNDDHDSELEIIECCEKAELTFSQEKAKRRKISVGDFSQNNGLCGCLSSDDGDSELEIINCCKNAELSFSEEKRKRGKSNKNDYDNAKEFELKIVSAKSGNFNESKNKNSTKKPTGKRSLLQQFDEKVNKEKVNCVDHFGMEDDDFEIMEVCKQAELSASQTSNSSPIHKEASSSPNMFGLFGVTSSDEDNIDACFDNLSQTQFDEIPDEILENIFCQLPLIDLLVSLSLVCKRWHRIISGEKFLLWKKRYYRYKYSFDSRSEIDSLIVQEQLHLPQTFPTQLCRFLTKFRTLNDGNSNLLDMLQLHSKYNLIEKFLEQSNMEQPYNCWSVIGLLCLVSSSVYDIQEIITCLFNSSSCLIYDVIECLHCLALIFFALMDKIPKRFISHHYRIYYALYLYENTSNCTQSSLKSAYSANTSGQQCILKYRESSAKTWLTHEQVRIMNHNTKQGDLLKIVAFAGTGKTTTLVEYTKLRPSWKFLNVAYNKSVQEHAAKRFPKNVESRTVHSLAYRAVGHKYRAKMSSSLRVSNIQDNLGKKDTSFLHAKRVVDTLSSFICSYDDCINLEHVPYRPITSVDTDGDRNQLEYYNSDKYKKIVVRDAKEIWEKMRDPGNRDVRITHDGYLKLYQLSKPVISNYDCILVDEAQDCTPAVSDILLRQTVAKILVGDPHQQIYGFRGATNAMALVDATHIYYLTQSFRFGSEIASVASSLLDILKGVRNKSIVGISKPGGFHGDHVGQIAVICRTNFVLFNQAVLTCTRNNKTRIGFAGGIQGYNLDRVLDIYKLYSGQNRDGIKDKFIKRFPNFAKLKQYALKAPDPELCGKIKIVEIHHIQVPNHVERLKKQNCSDIDEAEIIFSTAHKAKGLEFDTVRLGEDFLQDISVQDGLESISSDEKNLLYVAVTRAKLRLQCSTMLYHVLSSKTDLLETYESVSNVKDIQSTFCAECKRSCDFTESFVVMKRAEVVLGTTRKMDGGFLCTKCMLNRISYMGNLVGRQNNEVY